MSAVPADHRVAKDETLIAADLEHGVGDRKLTLTRSRAGSETLNTHFGPGWGDENVVRLSLIDQDALMIWRGGSGWRTAYRKGEKLFESGDGVKIQQTDGGWSAQMPQGPIFTFDGDGRLISERSDAGIFCNYTYDDRGRLISVGTTPENSLRYQYDQAGARVVRVEGPEKLQLDYRYDEKGRLIGATNSRKIQTEYRYSDDGVLVEAGDQFGHELKKAAQVSAPERLPASADIPTSDSSALRKTKYELDDKGRLREETAGGQKISYQRDKDGKIQSISSPQGTTACKYDVFGRIVSIQEPNGQSTRIEYDNLDLPTLIASSTGVTQKISYDQHGRVTRREAGPDDWEELTYDPAGRLKMTRRAPAAETHYGYDDLDRVVWLKHPGGVEVKFEFNPDGQPLTETWSTGETITRRYDAEGRLAELVNAAGLRTRYSYDGQGGTTTQDEVHGTTQHRTSGGETIVDGPAGKAIRETSAWGRLISATDPGGRKTVFQYDAAGKPESVTVPSGLAWRYEHDAAGELTGIISPGGVKIALKRDAGSRVITTTRGDVAWRQFRHDSAGRVEQEFSSAGRVASYKYDSAGKVTETEQPSGKFISSTQEKGLRRSVAGPDFQIEEELHSDGSLARRLYKPAGMDLRLPIDKHGRPAGISLNEVKASYNYDARGRLDRIDLPGGEAIQISNDAAGRLVKFVFGKGATLNVTYDRADRITVLDAKRTSPNDSIFKETYSYDPAGNVSEIGNGADAARKLEYDKDNQLTKVTGGKTQTFEYDTDGNLHRKGTQPIRWTLDKLGRPTNLGATNYSWDASGNLAKTQTAVAKTENAFDAADRLVRRSDGGKSWSYGYLPDGDRLWLQSAAGKSWYAYLPDRFAATKDANGVSWLLVCLPGTDWPVAFCGSNGQTVFIIADRLRSSRRLVDASGATTARMDFGAFGEFEESKSPKLPALFAGMCRDESGLFYARRRYYDPQIGRFLSIDPLIGTVGVPASHNAYAYAANNPLRFRDPQGTGFYDEIVYENFQHTEYLKDAAGNIIKDPHTGEQLIDRASKLVKGADNNVFDALTKGEQTAVREAYMAQKSAERTLANAAATAEQTRSAAAALRESEAALARLNQVGRLRHGHTLMRWTDQTVPGNFAKEKMAEYAQKMKDLGVDPLEHYSTEARRAMEKEAAEQASRRTFEQGSKTAQMPKPDAATAAKKGTQQVEKITAETAAEIAGKKGVEGAWEKSATGAVKEAGEKIAEGIGSKLWRGIKFFGPFIAIGGAALDIALVVEADKKAVDMYGAESERLKSKQLGREIIAKLDEEIRRIAREEPGRLMPMADGRMPDPNNPADLDEIIIDVHRNLNKKKDAFEGVLKPRVPKPGEEAKASADPNAPKDLAGALAEARKLIARGHEAEEAVRNALAKAAKAEVEAKNSIESATTIAAVQGVVNFDIAGLPVAANAVSTQTAAVKAQMKTLQAGYDAMTAAGAACDAASATACGFAGQAAGASPEQIKTWQSEATNAIMKASNELNAAQAKVDGADVAVDQLRSSYNFLQSFSLKVAAIRAAGKAAEFGGISSENSLAAARAANDRAAAARGPIPGLLEKINRLAAQAKAVLQPFASELEAAPLLAQAGGMGSGLDDTSIFDINGLIRGAAPLINPMIALVKNVDQALASVEIDPILIDAQNTLAEAERLRGAARALANGAERYQALQAASQCFAQIKAVPKVAEASPSPDVAEKEEVTVPDMATFDNVSEMKVALAHAGLVGAFSAKGKPPSKEKEFKFAGQAPAADTRVKRGSTVSVSIYQKFEATAEATPAATASDEVLVPSLAPFDNVSEMKVALAHAGLVGAFSAKGKPPSKEQEFKFAGQSPAASSKVKRGATVSVSIYQKFEDPTATVSQTPIQQAEASPSQRSEDEEVLVPNMAVFDSVSEMKSALAHNGLVGAFSAKGKPPSKEMEFKFAGQAPAADTKVKRGSTVSVSVYQKFEASAEASSSATPEVVTTTAGSMPNLIGLTIDQATTRLTSNMSIGGDEVGDKPPSEEKAYTIFSQYPAANSKIDPNKQVVVTVKRYGSAKVAAAEPTSPPSGAEPVPSDATGFEGKWAGTLSFANEKPQFVTVEIRREGSTYMVYQEKGKPIPMTVQDGRLVYEMKLDLSGMLGAESKDSDASTIRATATLVGDNELAVYLKVISKKEPKEGPLGTMKRVR